jgi:thiamine-phosphate pyrophosphorylase
VKPDLPRLHAITDEHIARRPDLDGVAQALSAAGDERIAFHARGRLLSGVEHLELARRLPTPLFVNDRLDIGLAAGARGVQLGQSSLSVADARRLEPHWWIGRSVHNLAEAEAAIAEGADYLVVGPVFPTATHPDREAVGTALFARIARLGRPTIAIGGVGGAPGQVAELAAAGAYGVAAIRALWDAADPATAARTMLEELA